MFMARKGTETGSGQGSKKEKNYAKEHLKKRLVTLQKKISKIQQDIDNKVAGVRLHQLHQVVTEYNQTLELIFTKQGAEGLPHYKVINGKAVVFIPKIEKQKREGKRKIQQKDLRLDAPQIEVKRMQIDYFSIFFDDERVIEQIEEAYAWANAPEKNTYKVQTSPAVKPGQVLFAIFDISGDLVFNMMFTLESPYIEYVKFLAVMSATSGYDPYLLVNALDAQRGLILPGDPRKPFDPTVN